MTRAMFLLESALQIAQDLNQDFTAKDLKVQHVSSHREDTSWDAEMEPSTSEKPVMLEMT